MARNDNDYYVYVYSHPDTRQPFYVGKGRGGRALAHMDFEDAENEKQEIISKLREQGRKPVIEIVRWKLTEDEAFAAEAALIQFIGLDQVTNRQRGHGEDKLHVDFLEFIRDKAPLRISPRKGEEMLVLCANQFYRPGMSRFELYDAIRGNLGVSKERTENCRLALVVYRGYVIDVYENPRCVEPGSQARQFESEPDDKKYDLVASFPDKDYRNRYVGRALDAKYAYARFTYEKIRRPRGRF